MIKVEIRGQKLFIRGIDRYKGKMKAQVDQALQASALVVQNEARQLVLKGPKTGRTYIRRGKIKHRASAPGEAPASDTGTLVRNIVTAAELSRNRVRIIAKTKYAAFLEYGTRKMKPRPFLIKALQNKIEQIKAIFAASLRKS